MEIQIHQFRQILFWPLEIPRLSARDNLTTVDAFETDFVANGLWQREKDLLKRGEQTQDSEAYAELVYFHPFVQRFLYGEAGSEPETAERHNTPVRLYRREDIKGARVEISLRNYAVDPPLDTVHDIELAIERLHFYLFDHGVAILVVEVRALAPLSLTLAEELLDRFRRAYPPYWETMDDKPGHCPKRVKWLNADGTVAIESSDYEESAAFEQFVKAHKTPAPARHWRYLLRPLAPWPGKNGSQGFSYRQLEDERMPFMAYLSLHDPGQLSRADFVRLCFADGSGSSARLPYARDFLRNFEENHCYDRYWDPRMDYAQSDPAAEPNENWMTSRYLCCGYGFVMVGKEDPQFFADGKNGALAHFRRHYFQMGLVAHFHRAALLLFSDALSRAVAKLNAKHRKTFRAEIKTILAQFLSFTHRYWFREVSNQMQARELFTLWTRHLDTQALFDQVKQEAQDANDFLDMQRQQRQTDTTVRLTVVATVGLAAGLIAAYLAVPWQELYAMEMSWDAFRKEWWKVGLAAGAVGCGTALTVWQSERISGWLQCLSECGKSGGKAPEI